ncbi:tyrosine phosphatase family-domain-containing protein [Kalaharituber pfeilii]|nr:tyrosine phosphatase family-domain-containing protein [Kalaharituber pfeilii]
MSTIPVSPDIQVPGSPAATSTTTSTAASPSITDFNSPPWVNVPGIVNFRDIGGYPISDGRRSVRRGLVYRSAEPSRVTADGRKKMQELGIKKMYDLRSEKELNRLGDLTKIVEIDGVERVFVPVIPDRDYSPE